MRKQEIGRLAGLSETAQSNRLINDPSHVTKAEPQQAGQMGLSFDVFAEGLGDLVCAAQVRAIQWQCDRILCTMGGGA